jgi:collagenase-like PrtC family protease
MKDEPLDPAKMMEIINRLKVEGRLPSPEEFISAMVRIREKYRQKVADASKRKTNKVPRRPKG